MTESELSLKCLHALNALPNCKALKTHGSPMFEAGTPDLLICLAGKFYAIELKVGKNQPTMLQHHRLMQWQTAGATVGVCRSVEEVIQLVSPKRRTEPEP
jgi:hypothetical protein